jgi:hypothetical protein
MADCEPHEDDGATDVLLICPMFFSYHKSIVQNLESRGLRVTWWNDRVSDSPLYKIALRLIPCLIGSLSTRGFLNRIACLNTTRITQVLVIKGEGLSPASVRALRKALPTARFVYYLWDAVENVRGAVRIAPLFDNVATFDPVDARRFGWVHRPLFARQLADQAAEAASAWDLVFIGTLHSDRLRVLQRLLARSGAGLRTFAFGFIPGRLMWAIRHLTDPAMWRKENVHVSTMPMASDAVRDIVNAARAVVDIEHPRQRGLTMRTIETLLAGRKLVTTNRYIVDSDLYHPSRICVVARKAPIVSQGFLMSDFVPLKPTVMRHYSLSGWVDELLNLGRHCKTHREAVSTSPKPTMATMFGAKPCTHRPTAGADWRE